MKLLSRDGDRYVFLIRRSEHETLLELLGLRGRLLRRRRPRKLSRSGDAKLDKAGEEMGRSLAQNRRQQSALLKRLLNNPAKCVPTASGFGLELTKSEFEGLLQALNDINIRAWETLGRPDFQAGERVDASPENLFLVGVLRVVSSIQSALLEALNE